MIVALRRANPIRYLIQFIVLEYGYDIITVWPEILAGNLFWWIGGFESNPPIFHPPNTFIIIAKS